MSLRGPLVIAIVAGAFACSAPVTASPPVEPPQTLDLCAYRATFIEDFDELSVSSWGGNTRWIAHTPWAGDFGEAEFANPGSAFPFRTVNGMLRIEARRFAGNKWRAGLLASADPTTRGFAQQYGYFEMRARFPKGPGLWPAFWLVSNLPKDSKEPAVEIDVVEHYGHEPDRFHSAVHVWDRANDGEFLSEEHIKSVSPDSLYETFHTYGVDVAPDWISFFLDRRQIWKFETPSALKQPLLVLVDLALGSGWPIDNTPDHSVLEVDYIHVYKRQDDPMPRCKRAG